MARHDLTSRDWEDDLRRLRLRMAAAATFLAVVTLVGVMGYRYLAPDSTWVDAFYMTAITLTTVGLSVQRQVVLIADDPDEIAEIRTEFGDVPVVLGDPTSDDTLTRAGPTSSGCCAWLPSSYGRPS